RAHGPPAPGGGPPPARKDAARQLVTRVEWRKSSGRPGKKGTGPFVRSTLRAVPAKGPVPFFPGRSHRPRRAGAVSTTRFPIMLSEPEPVLPPRAEDWAALKEAIQRFEHAWRQGPRPRIDDFLSAENLLRSFVLIELVHIDLELRLKAGETARVEEYLAHY